MVDRLSVGSAAPDAALVNASGEVIQLADVWANGPTVLTFLRHFG